MGFGGRRQSSVSGTSRMNREVHVRFCERLGVKFPGPTRPHDINVRAFGHIEAGILDVVAESIAIGVPASCARPDLK
jgi:hypothetical protein